MLIVTRMALLLGFFSRERKQPHIVQINMHMHTNVHTSTYMQIHIHIETLSSQHLQLKFTSYFIFVCCFCREKLGSQQLQHIYLLAQFYITSKIAPELYL